MKNYTFYVFDLVKSFCVIAKTKNDAALKIRQMPEVGKFVNIVCLDVQPVR